MKFPNRIAGIKLLTFHANSFLKANETNDKGLSDGLQNGSRVNEAFTCLSIIKWIQGYSNSEAW